MAGFFKVPNELLSHGKALGPCGIAVYCVLACHANADGWAWPSYDTIAREANLSRRKAVEMVAVLERLGFLKTDRSHGRKTNRYILNSAPHAPLGAANGAPGAPFGANGAPGAPHQCTPCTVNGAPGAPEQDPLEQDPRNKTNSAPAEPAPAAKQPRQKKSSTATDRKPRQRDELFDAVAEIAGADPALVGDQIGMVCSKLRKATPPYTAAEVRRLPDVRRQRRFNVPLTLHQIPQQIKWVREESTNGPTKPGPGQRFDPNFDYYGHGQGAGASAPAEADP